MERKKKFATVVESNPKFPFLFAIYRDVWKSTTLYCGLLHSSFDSYLKEASNTIFWVFGTTRPQIERQSPGPLASTLLTRSMDRLK